MIFLIKRKIRKERELHSYLIKIEFGHSLNKRQYQGNLRSKQSKLNNNSSKTQQEEDEKTNCL